MSLDAIEAAESNTHLARQQRQRLWDQWQTYLDEMDTILKNESNDYTESPTILKVMSLCHYISGQLTRESTLSLIDFLREHQVKNLTESYKPGLKQFAPLAVQIIGSIASGAVGIAPAVLGYTGNQGQSFHNISTTINGVCVNGGSSVGQIMHTLQQGEQADCSNKLEVDKRILSDLDHMRQQALQASQRRDQTETEDERQRHQAWNSVAAN